MLRGSSPSATGRPTQNWWVDQALSTLGMPTRSSERRFARAEGSGANHLRDVGEFTLRLLDLRLHHPQLVNVLDEALGAGVSADHALESLADGHLAPWPALRA